MPCTTILIVNKQPEWLLRCQWVRLRGVVIRGICSYRRLFVQVVPKRPLLKLLLRPKCLSDCGYRATRQGGRARQSQLFCGGVARIFNQTNAKRRNATKTLNPRVKSIWDGWMELNSHRNEGPLKRSLITSSDITSTLACGQEYGMATT